MTPVAPPRWTVVVDPRKCTLCEVCAVRCPTTALKVLKEAEKQSLVFEASLCDACGGDVRCHHACPEKCLDVVEIGARKPKASVVLAAGKLVRCVRCGVTFAAQKKLQAVGRRSGPRPRDLHERCPSCRRDHLLTNLIP